METALEKAYIPADILMIISAQTDDAAKDQLRSTCRFMAKNLSIKPPYVRALVTRADFQTHTNNMSFIALNAAWNGDIDTVENILKNTNKQPLFYRYNAMLKDCYSRINIIDVIRGRQAMKGINPIWDNMSALIRKYKRDHGYGGHTCTELMMACYAGDADRLRKHLAERAKISRHFSDPKNFGFLPYEIPEALLIATNRDQGECITLLVPYIKKPNTPPSDEDYEAFNNLLYLLCIVQI